MTDLTHSSQDYLRIIYDLIALYGRATTSQIASRLGIRPASVTSMLQKLSDTKPPLVHYQKYQGVILTPAGEVEALRLIRSHRVLESYLKEALGYTWDEVHDEAERLEHVVSPQVIDRMAHILGDPIVNPHGQPIPTADLEIDPSRGVRLADLELGVPAVILRVRDDCADHLRYLGHYQLRPGVILTVDARLPDDTLIVTYDKYPGPVEVAPTMSTQVYVRLLVDDANERDLPIKSN